MAQEITIVAKSSIVKTLLIELRRKAKQDICPAGGGISDNEARAIAKVLPKFGIEVVQERGNAVIPGWYGWYCPPYLTKSQVMGLRKFVDEYEYSYKEFKITSI